MKMIQFKLISRARRDRVGRIGAVWNRINDEVINWSTAWAKLLTVIE